MVDLPSREVLPAGTDEWELSMRRHAAKMAREIVSEELPAAVGTLDYQFAGRLEREFRRAGAEDLVILLTNGSAAPGPARGATLRDSFSVAVALGIPRPLDPTGETSLIGGCSGVDAKPV